MTISGSRKYKWIKILNTTYQCKYEQYHDETDGGEQDTDDQPIRRLEDILVETDAILDDVSGRAREERAVLGAGGVLRHRTHILQYTGI